MSAPIRSAALVVLAIVVTACAGLSGSVSSRPSAPASTPPSSAPTSTPGAIPAIEHPTGATDVVLRFEEGGGFVPMEFSATEVPIFTLYGDGTMIFRNPARESLPVIGSVSPLEPLRTARLSEEQIQTTLVMAIRDGGLGTARPNYRNDMVADASTATFTLNAGGLQKTVSVYALGIEAAGSPDGPARAAFAKLAGRLRDFDQGGSIRTDAYAADRYRGILMDGQPGDPEAKPWPWPDLKPTDFVTPADPNSWQIPVRILTVAQAEALGIAPYQGGFRGPTLIGPNGKPYYFSLRPLLPDESR
jgi:hypothetical protein